MDTNYDGVVNEKDKILYGGQDSKDNEVLGIIQKEIDSFSDAASKRPKRPLHAQLTKGQLWVLVGDFERNGKKENLATTFRVFSIPLLDGENELGGYQIIIYDLKTNKVKSLGIIEAESGGVTLFDSSTSGGVSYSVDRPPTVQNGGGDSLDYWKTVGDCIRRVLDGSFFANCAAACINPSSVSCLQCLAAATLGGMIQAMW